MYVDSIHVCTSIVYMYVCMYVCICMYIYVHIHIDMQINPPRQANSVQVHFSHVFRGHVVLSALYVYIYIYAFILKLNDTLRPVCMYIYVYVCTFILKLNVYFEV
jgi:hypothetical protein